MFASLALAAIVTIGAVQGAPIQVESCSFVRAGSFEHSVRIRFHNVSDRTATIVAFDVHNGPHHVTVRDYGTFSPGATIERVFTTPTWELYHAPARACTVSYVRFEDGTTWTAGSK